VGTSVDEGRRLIVGRPFGPRSNRSIRRSDGRHAFNGSDLVTDPASWGRLLAARTAGKGTNAAFAVFKGVCATLLLVALFSASEPGSALAEDRVLDRKCLPTEVDGEPDFPTVTVTRHGTEPAHDPIDSRGPRVGSPASVLRWTDGPARIIVFVVWRTPWVVR
jgi:hypothetical protein